MTNEPDGTNLEDCTDGSTSGSIVVPGGVVTNGDVGTVTSPTEHGGGGFTGGINTGVLTYADKIWNAAKAYWGTSTKAGPSGGDEACVWALNNVLAKANLAPIPNTNNNVDSLETELPFYGYTQTTTPVAGDLAIEGADEHVGICMDDGCNLTLSNSTTNDSFTYFDNASFSQSYSGDGSPRFYHHT